MVNLIPYFDKDSVRTPKAFIYHPDALGYSVIQLRDSLFGQQVNKPIRTVELEATGVIESPLKPCKTVIQQHAYLFYGRCICMDHRFYCLDKGDRFKVIYTEKLVDDSISVGIERLKQPILNIAEKAFMLMNLKQIVLKELWIILMIKPKTYVGLF